MSEFKTIEERYGSAVEASDLTLRFERGGQVDVLTAAGMVGVHHPLAMSIWRWVYGGDANERHAVLVGLVKWTKTQASRRQWNKMQSIVPVVMTVADWYCHKTCPVCNGTRYEQIEGTPSLSDVPCSACHGSGEISLDKLLVQFGPEWIKRGKELRCHIDALVNKAAPIVLAKIKRDIDLSGL